MLARGITANGKDRNGRYYTRVMPGLGIAPWLQRTMGLRIREALGVRKADFRQRPDGARYLHLCWQASDNGRELEPLKHRKAGEFRDIPVPDMVWDMVAELPDGPLCPGPSGTPRWSSMRLQVLGHDGIETTLRFYIHASANAEQRIGKMMNARWTAKPKPKPAG